MVLFSATGVEEVTAGAFLRIETSVIFVAWVGRMMAVARERYVYVFMLAQSSETLHCLA